MHESLVYDPLGNCISVAEDICGDQLGAAGTDIYDHITAVISKPALIIETIQNKQRFYFRSVGWNNTVLIRVENEAGGWVASQCRLNPIADELTALLASGTQLH